ncbi:MAG: hypothetical protein Q4E56_04755 [Pseudomonadota bacterium]|nr:hypothetical protein [Pseudomonadota bacterium]
MHYTLRVNEKQFGDLIAAIICAEAAEAEAIELFHDRDEIRERSAESLTRLGKLRYYLQKEKERDEV